jgi:hypothetical protein
MTSLPRVIPDLEGANYVHALTHHLSIAIGTYTYFLHDVTDPDPGLLLTHPILYESQIKCAGGKVAFKYLQHVGVPVLHFLRAGRSSDGDKCEQLHALSYHMHRSTTHKINCVQIALIALASTLCTHPLLSDVVKATTSGSFTGKIGSLAYMDRLNEYINLLQEQRNGKFAAFETALHYSHHLIAMMHVEQMWTCASAGDSPLHDPMRQSILNAAEVIRQDMLAKLGTDLTMVDERNPFWHTGNPTNWNGNKMAKKPWEYVWDVAEGRVAGKGRVAVESSDAYVARVIREQFW